MMLNSKQEKLAEDLGLTPFEVRVLEPVRTIGLKNNNQWLAFHPKDALIFADTQNVWNELKGIYTSEFRNQVYGALPNDNLLLERISNRLSYVPWNIELIQNK